MGSGKKDGSRFWGETWFHNIVAKPGFVVGSGKNDATGFGVKPGFTTLLQNQDLSLEAKKQMKGFVVKPDFTNIDRKTRICRWKQKSMMIGFVVKPGFTTLLQNQDSSWEAKKLMEEVLG